MLIDLSGLAHRLRTSGAALGGHHFLHLPSTSRGGLLEDTRRHLGSELAASGVQTLRNEYAPKLGQQEHCKASTEAEADELE